MFFPVYLVWMLNLVVGFLIFKSCYRTSSINYFLLNSLTTIIVFFVHLKLIFIEFLHLFIVCIPVLISVLKVLIDFTQESRDYEKNLSKVILFLDLIIAKIRFGRGIKESIANSHYIITLKSHVNFLFKKNVVLQQPKSRFFKIFHELEDDLSTILDQKVGQKDLIEHIKKKYQKRLVLHQKTKIALSQYHSQSLVIGFFWLAANGFLISQDLFLKYINIVLISFLLLLIGSFISKKLLVVNEFRI